MLYTSLISKDKNMQKKLLLLLLIFHGCSSSPQTITPHTKDYRVIRIYKKLKNPSEEIQIIAVKKNYRVLKYIKNPSTEVQKVAIKTNSKAIELIENLSEEIQLSLIKKDFRLLSKIKNPTKKVIKEATLKRYDEADKISKRMYNLLNKKGFCKNQHIQHQPASKKMLVFIDKHVGLDIFFNNKKIKDKHNLTYRPYVTTTWSSGRSETTLESSEIFYKKKKFTKNKGFIIYDGLYKIDTTPMPVRVNEVHSRPLKRTIIDIGLILDRRYHHKDVENALKRKFPEFKGEYGHKDIKKNSRPNSNQIFKYKNIYFKVYINTAGTSDTSFKKTIVTFTLIDVTSRVTICKRGKQIEYKKLKEKVKEEEKQREMGKELVL